MDLTTVLSQVLVLFILITIGVILRKFNIINDSLGKGLSNFIVYATIPSLLITSMNYDFSKEMLSNGVLVLAIGPFAYVFAMLVGYIFTKIKHIENPDRGIYQFATIFPNGGFMGFPIVAVVYGEIGIFYSGLFNLWFNILLWTLGMILSTPNKNKNINFKMLINPGTIAITIGIVLFLFSIKLPTPLFQALDSLGNTTIPLAMVVIGSMLGESNIKNVISNKLIVITTFLRLIIIPLPLLFILNLLPLPKIVIGIIAITMSMPVAANAAIFARKNNSNYKLASELVFLSTLCSIATIPIFISLVIKIVGV
ncbi:AEC family transporter [Senegalia massiliensis]|uniref:AEC family transporter n=1 Tax=Senegalia massiliensis TaxID=1720316 RepID=UPI001030CDA2|nr:AEC family transporter [Senegalia massiliensis]